MFKFYLMFFLVIMSSCGKDDYSVDIYRIGDIDLYSIYSNKQHSIDLMPLELDTISFDTLSISLESSPISDFSIVIKQSLPFKQEFFIYTSDRIQLQLHAGFKNENSYYVKSSIFNEEININQNWTNKDCYFYTLIQGNFRVAPRPLVDYIPVLYNSEQLGWVKIKTVIDENWVVKKMLIEEYSFKK